MVHETFFAVAHRAGFAASITADAAFSFLSEPGVPFRQGQFRKSSDFFACQRWIAFRQEITNDDVSRDRVRMDAAGAAFMQQRVLFEREVTRLRFDQDGVVALLGHADHFFAGLLNDLSPVDDAFTRNTDQVKAFPGMLPFDHQCVHRAVFASPHQHADLLSLGKAGEVGGEVVLAQTVVNEVVNFLSGFEKGRLRVKGCVAGFETDHHFHHAFVQNAFGFSFEGIDVRH